MRLALSLLVLALASQVAPAAEEALPPNARILRLETRPTAIELTTPFAYSQLLVTAHLDGGTTADVTRLVEFDAPSVVKVSPAGLIRPAADGKGDLTVSLPGVSAKVLVTVSGQKTVPPVSFVRDVQPVLSKLGCNAGTCHGAAQGKNGFKLSLRGYDPLFDHRSLTDDEEARRFNRAAPERSLMLMKPAGAVPHVGGVVWNPGDPNYELAKTWIAQGVKLDLATTRVASIEVFPKNPTVQAIGGKQQFAVIATYADGKKRDVSAEAFIESSNTEVATVDKTGLMTSVRRGESTMLARYEGAYAASTVIVMGDRSGYQWSAPPQFNWIDELVDKKLQRIKVKPSELCDDAEFIRRVSIDLTGLPPSADEVRAFLADKRPTREKRDALIDKLVGSDAYVEHWTNKWGDLLQVNRKFLGDPGATALRKWIKDAVAENMPYDEFCYAILTASGSNVANPPAAYYKVLRDPDAVMENTTQLFLAVRFNCNKCHDHPFEKWTQDQYYQLAAYFAQITRKEDPKYKGQRIGGTAVEGAKPLVEDIEDTKSGEVTHVRTGQVAAPKFPYTYASAEAPKAVLPRRVQVAKWITSPANPYFAKSYVNRVWSYLLGVGIIEPVDDIRAGNPPTNPELLDRLTKEFVDSEFDVQALVGTICKSRTYQLSIAANQWNKDDDINYAKALPRRLPAEVLYDAIHKATGSTTRLPGVAPGTRAAQLLDSNVELPGGFLELLGKPVRESACECERSNNMMLGPVLAFVSGPVVGDAVHDQSNHIAQITLKEKDDAKVVEEIYLSILNRRPNSTEVSAGVKALEADREDHAKQMADFWTKVAAFEAYKKTIDGKQAAWEAGLHQLKPTDWVVLTPTKAESKAGPTPAAATKAAKLEIQKDGSVLVSGPLETVDVYTLTTEAKLPGTITAIRLEALADAKLPGKGPGRSQNGNFVLNEFRVSQQPLPPLETSRAAVKKSDEKSKAEDKDKKPADKPKAADSEKKPADKPKADDKDKKPEAKEKTTADAKDKDKKPEPKPAEKPKAVKLTGAQATFAQDGFPPQNAIDNNPATGWAIVPQVGMTQAAMFRFQAPVKADEGVMLTVVLDQRYGGGHNLGKFRLSVTTDKNPKLVSPVSAELAKLLDTPGDERTTAQKADLRNRYLAQDAEYQRLAREAAKVPPADPRVLGAQDLAWALINTPAFLFNH
jgi:hypothetical protein